MNEQYEIHPSNSQAILLLLLLALAAITALICIDSKLLSLIYLGAVLLLTVTEIRHTRQAEVMRLILNIGDESIILEQGGQPYFYVKYKVYPTRWFAILKLFDQQKTKTLILNPERFKSPQAYRSCRYRLLELERVAHAA